MARLPSSRTHAAANRCRGYAILLLLIAQAGLAARPFGTSAALLLGLGGRRLCPATHRGHGLGRALVKAVIDHARAHVVLLQAAVGVANAPALRLYASLGFRHYGREDKALLVDGVFVDEALIVLDFAADA